MIYAEPKFVDPDESPFNYNPTREALIGLGLGLIVGFAWKVSWSTNVGY